MTLSEEDLALFYKLHPALLIYVNQQLQVDPTPTPSVEDFMKLPLERKGKIRNALYEHLHLIDSFTADNPSHFSDEELEIVRGWKDALPGTFYLVRHLKKYAVFLDQSTPARAYGVLSLTDDLEEMFGDHVPLMVNAVLLPFKGQIIYDGMLAPYQVYFGPGLRESLNADYQEAKARYGIITSLPFTPPQEEQGDAERLRFYLKNEANRERYWEEIEELIEKSLELRTLYHQERGKHHARVLGRRLRELGLSNAWFALLEGTVISSGRSKEEVEEILRSILPEEKIGFVYFYHLRG
ncbi:MAG: hypothetical protein KY468_01355 [Armatimonadetes bacterium]|nr:hypothetical protein [Armatimonadota bacterium]